MKHVKTRGPTFASWVAAAAVAIAPGTWGATQAEIDNAIQDGLAWLATQQYPDGHFGSGPYPLAYTAAALLAFENEGHFPGAGSAYSSQVEAGLDYILARARKITIGLQTAGNPDGDGDGIGVCWWDNSQYREVYETGMIMMALVASSTPDRVVTAGPCAGNTYREVMQDVVDWAAFGQVDSGPGRGGWRYYANFGNSDNSTAQWPVLGLVAAEQWGITAPQFVKDELNIWIDYVQNNSSGGSGYDDPDQWVNEAKTGGLLVEMYYVGDGANTPRAQAAVGFLNAHWNSTPSGWDGNKGHPYAMFSIFKGLELMGITSIPNAPATPETPAGDWYGDYTEYLVNHQHPDGSWSGYYTWDQWLSTGWYIVILQATVFPVQVAVDLPPWACDSGYEFNVTYSVERFPADGTLTVFEDDVKVASVSLEDFQGTATQTFVVESDSPGNHQWRAVLSVTSESGVSASAEDSAAIQICETPSVAGIPNQVAPFQPFDLDDYVSYNGAGVINWTIEGVPDDWSVTLDKDNVVTLSAPSGAGDPVDLTFTASVACCDDLVCASSDVATFVPNQPPDCSGAIPSVDILWPPNHKLIPVEVLGVIDPDGDPIQIRIDSIFQDEPLNTYGDGTAIPDADGVGASIALLRAERSGTKKVAGNGRVYHVLFTALDGRGGMCEGEVVVAVPHDMKHAIIDDGPTVDSTGQQ